MGRVQDFVLVKTRAEEILRLFESSRYCRTGKRISSPLSVTRRSFHILSRAEIVLAAFVFPAVYFFTLKGSDNLQTPAALRLSPVQAFSPRPCAPIDLDHAGSRAQRAVVLCWEGKLNQPAFPFLIAPSLAHSWVKEKG